MMLVRIEPDMLNHHRHTFECSNCKYTESNLFKFK